MQKYARLRDAVKGEIKFELWPHQVYLTGVFEKHPLIIILKARQLGITWLVAMYALWKAMFQEGANVLILSKNEMAASESLAYARFCHQRMPDFLRLSKGKDSDSAITFPIMSSTIRALPATEAAGVGFGSASLVILDENDFHPYAEQNYVEIKPMIDAGEGRQLIILSAPNKYEADTKFKSLYRQARAGDNNFLPVFLPYDCVPYRNEEWYQDKRRDYESWEMEGRYPKTEGEALSAPQLTCRFNIECLESMLNDCRSPIRSAQNGAIKYWKEPIANRAYVMSIDSSSGVDDPSCGVILDGITCEQVAEFHGKLSVDQQALIIQEMYDYYHAPYTAVERNADGRRLIDKLVDMGVKNWHVLGTEKDNNDKKGFWTSAKSRPIILGQLADAILNRELIVNNEQAVRELFAFQRTEKHPDGIAIGGAHDDYVMALAIALEIRKSAHLTVREISEPRAYKGY